MTGPAGAGAIASDVRALLPWLAALTVLLPSAASAAEVVLAGAARLDPPLATREDLDPGVPPELLTLLDGRLSVPDLERLGLSVATVGDRLRVSYAGVTAEHDPAGGWRLEGAPPPPVWFPAPPVGSDGLVWVPVSVLAGLGIGTVVAGDTIVLTLPAAPATPAPVVLGPNRVLDARVAKGRATRLALEVERPADYRVETEPGRVRVRLRDSVAAARFMPVNSESVSRIRVVPSDGDTLIEVDVALRAATRVFTLADPSRLVIDAEVPAGLPPAAGPIPAGISYRILPVGGSRLHLLEVDPAQHEASLAAAPWGGSRNVMEFGQLAGAVLAVNGGYFDPASGLAVDLASPAGQVLAYARGNRATLGLMDGRVGMFGTPRVRLALEVDTAEGPRGVNVSAIRPGPNPAWVTAFVGDGFVPAGAPGFATLTIRDDAVAARDEGPVTPAPGTLTVSFDPKVWPALDLPVGARVRPTVTWNEPAWAAARDVLAAGPLLVLNGAIALDPAREGFDTGGEIWRATRQAAIGSNAAGWLVVAMLEHGTPEALASALLAAGLRDAVRLDSGTSAAVYLNGGMLAGKWGRTVPNAIVVVPRAGLAAGRGARAGR